MIALVVFTDGRADCLRRTLASAEDHLHGPITHRVVFDDSGDPDYAQWLRANLYRDRYDVVSWKHRRGFSGTIDQAWKYLIALDYDVTTGTPGGDPKPERLVFHLEDDFEFRRDVDLEAMAWVLDHRPSLVQLALRRQPWNDEERTAGGIVELHPEAYEERDAGALAHVAPDERLAEADWSELRWLEHRLFFTTNPSLYRRSLCDLGWPVVDRSEGMFTHRLLEDPDVRFGFWGTRDSGEWVEHIGAQRVGTGY